MRHRWMDKFVFIHINKTGGTSVAKALNIPTIHRTALEKIEEIGREEWNRRFTFAVVRNPWDKVVSHYHYRVQTDQTNLGEGKVDFKTWVTLSYGKKDPAYYNKPKMFMPQTKWVVDQTGEMIVDYICRFESLSSDFEQVCKRLNLDASLPHLKSSKRGSYQDYYDSATKAIVADWFAEDVEQFHYTF
ncbi:sulfotransferase family 2 domain-containing protein [Synechococcus sp. PCC 7335]|uniref:sulfotransferase family 2 domain-containing protein n=1 Tax=Synechococcus sp. (strain ATCC 29403 / PCC 7335) TaxID=91464 RepID=UPI0018DC6EEF|nr:sulfotransferase family 2 domain-containing protein [Synechococcus sp. PCC 7335]